MNLFAKFKIIGRNRRAFYALPEVTAGHIAEQQLAAILSERLVGSEYTFHQSLRIPYKKGRREVDFVITRPGEVWLVELKNWSGFVAYDGGKIVQHRSQGRGVVEHGSLLKTMLLKERALKEYLEPRLNEVPAMISVLVFWNQHVSIAEELLEREDVVVMGIREFLGSLPPAPPDYGFILGIFVRLFRALSGSRQSHSRAGKDGPTEQENLAVNQALSELGSWDMVRMHGGRILSGDILSISHRLLGDRRRIRQILIDAPRSWLQALKGPLVLRACAQSRSGKEELLELGFDETVTFQGAGQSKPEELALRDLEMVVFGYAERR